MRVLIVSDIHSNFIALETVLAVAGSFDQLWNLGDTIGYGPRPNECVQAMRDHADVMLSGNHDLACLGKLDLTDFNPDARTANIWNGHQLTDENRALLDELSPRIDLSERFLLAHGSPREPVWEYLLSRPQAESNFELFSQQVCLIGHSHIPLLVRQLPDGQVEDPMLADAELLVEFEPGYRYFFNPGSVGQPRNQDPRAAYALLDTEAGTIMFKRVEYDIAQTQRQMREARLPPALVRRLEYGM
ncbi:MAG TPA: metallophosphoesterase family protein [Kouleothrix sp.]|mgnify:CR=1 FL=1|uniref:metallophosphoesterase family protein n=1 Tax=Kouleothrix sp. TaxID=2779161 RepID=UPI002BC85B45|nr:metallophosphoesterase family protein [Kouleothrix sp.]HRC76533.1 metallophosphoesterase family protein [Kouleothrix sp.]